MKKKVMRNIGNISSVLIILTLSLLFLSTAYAADEIKMISEGLITSSQEINFITCVEGVSVKNFVFCRDDQELTSLPTIDWGEGCYLSSIDLGELACSDIELQATYLKNDSSKKITKTVHPKKTLSDPEGILDSQNWDGGWGTPSDTAYAIWILSTYAPKYEKQISEGLEWLKVKRLDDEKCWPSENTRCDTYETARTLLFLKYAGIDLDEKVFLDGMRWLESRMNSIDDNDWELKVIPNEDGECSVKYETSSLFSGEVEADEPLVIPFKADYGKLINVSCINMSEKVYIYDHEKRNIFYKYFEEDNDDYFDYTIVDDEDYEVGDSSIYRLPPPCWSSSVKWDYCNRKTTLYATLLDDIDEDKLKLAKKWLEDELRSGTYVGSYLSTEDSILDTSLMLYDFDFSDEDDKESVRRWLVHNQNNDGSWGDGDNLNKNRPTGFALLALKNYSFSSDAIVINDGISWMSRNYPRDGWSSFENEAISFLLLRETAKKFLKADKLPIILNSTSSKLSLENPSGFDLKNISYTVTGTINDKVKVSGLTNIDKFETKTVNIEPIPSRAGFYSGLVNIFSNGSLLLEIPVSFQQQVEFNIEPLEKTIHVFSDTGKAMFKATTNADFSCNLVWSNDNINSKTTHTITSSGNFEVPFTLANLQSGTHSGVFTCSYKTYTYEIPFSLEIFYHEDPPFKINKDAIFLKEAGENATVKIKNLLNDRYLVTTKFSKEPYSLSLDESSFYINPDETVELKIVNFAVPIEEVTTEESALLQINAFDHQEVVDVRLEVLPLGVERSSLWPKLIFLAVIAAIGGGVWYYFKKKKEDRPEDESEKKDARTPMQKIKDWWKEFRVDLREVLPEKYKHFIPKTKEEIAEEKAKMHKEIERVHLKDMVMVMKKLKKSEKEIKDKLSHEGLSAEEIDEVIRMVNLDEKFQDDVAQEEQSLKMVQELETNKELRTVLQERGFGKDTINKAFEEIEKSIEEKEKILKDRMGNKDNVADKSNENDGKDKK